MQARQIHERTQNFTIHQNLSVKLQHPQFMNASHNHGITLTKTGTNLTADGRKSKFQSSTGKGLKRLHTWALEMSSALWDALASELQDLRWKPILSLLSRGSCLPQERLCSWPGLWNAHMTVLGGVTWSCTKRGFDAVAHLSHRFRHTQFSPPQFFLLPVTIL